MPAKADAGAIHQLIGRCPPLDLNSVYAYLLLSEHFAATCVLAESDAGLEGFVSAYVPPGRTDVLFVWQVAVNEHARGSGLGLRMLQDLLGRPGLAGIRYVETTVSPDNMPSRRMFAGLARRSGATITESALFDSQLFGQAAHDDERLLRIGPLRPALPDI